MSKIVWKETDWRDWGGPYKGMKTYRARVGGYNLYVGGPSKIHPPEKSWIFTVKPLPPGTDSRHPCPEEAKAAAINLLKRVLLSDEASTKRLRDALEEAGEL